MFSLSVIIQQGLKFGMHWFKVLILELSLFFLTIQIRVLFCNLHWQYVFRSKFVDFLCLFLLPSSLLTQNLSIAFLKDAQMELYKSLGYDQPPYLGMYPGIFNWGWSFRQNPRFVAWCIFLLSRKMSCGCLLMSIKNVVGCTFYH